MIATVSQGTGRSVLADVPPVLDTLEVLFDLATESNGVGEFARCGITGDSVDRGTAAAMKKSPQPLKRPIITIKAALGDGLICPCFAGAIRV